MAYPEWIGSGTHVDLDVFSSTPTSYTFGHPSSLEVGDLMVMFVEQYSSSGIVTWDPPSGWDFIGDWVISPTLTYSHRHVAMFKVAEAGDVAAGSTVFPVSVEIANQRRITRGAIVNFRPFVGFIGGFHSALHPGSGDPGASITLGRDALVVATFGLQSTAGPDRPPNMPSDGSGMSVPALTPFTALKSHIFWGEGVKGATYTTTYSTAVNLRRSFLFALACKRRGGRNLGLVRGRRGVG